MNDPRLFGDRFVKKPKDWLAWRAFLAALFGLPMTPNMLAIYQQCTNRQSPPEKQAEEAYQVIGRRGGKTNICALIAVYLACFRSYEKDLAPGEVATAMVIAADRKQARSLMNYIKGYIHSSKLLESMVIGEDAESIRLNNRVVIEVHTAQFRTVRGYSSCLILMDEIAFWRSEDSANPDFEILNALRPSTGTITNSMIIGLSSPYARRGVLWDAYTKHFGKEGDGILVWQAPTKVMHPSFSDKVIQRAFNEDEAHARAEYGAEFRRDLEAYVSKEVLDRCTIWGRTELPPQPDMRYYAFVDVSGGSQDSMTLCIAHGEDGVGIVDRLLEVIPPFSPDDVVANFAKVCREYGCAAVKGDKYGGEWPRERFRAHGIAYDPADMPKSDFYKALLPLLNADRVQLIENIRLYNQLQNLERKVSRSGKDSIDHAPGGHDDCANAIAGAIVEAAQIYDTDVLAANLSGSQRERMNLKDGLAI